MKPKPFALIVVLCPALLVAASCRPAPDLDLCRQEVLDMHREFIDAHLAKDAATLAAPIADDYLFVRDGGVTNQTASEVESNLKEYLDAATFTEYGDLEDPIVGVSRDGSLAWAIVQVRVAGERDMGEGVEPAVFDTRWAWITLYERRGDAWARIADVSTNRPFDEGS